jgi:recombination protein RecA
MASLARADLESLLHTKKLDGTLTHARSDALQPEEIPRGRLSELMGRLVELSADAEAAHLTAAFGLVLDAQLGGDRAAWITLEHSSFFPPDVVDGGVDLEALPVVRVPDARAAGRAADHLVRSGGFGLVVIDLSSGADARVQSSSAFDAALLTRLLGLPRQQNAAVLILTKKSLEAPSLHSLISLRAEARWRLREGRYELCVRVLKDKRGGAGWTAVETCRGPAGVR